MTYRPRVLVLGDGLPAEFQPALTWLSRESLLIEPSLPLDTPGSFGTPDLVVFLQNRPGQWTRERVEPWHERWPLARLVMLLGSWCEGEPRTGRPVAGVSRVLWHQWEPQAERYWAQRGEGRHPWNLPRASTGVDLLLEAGNTLSRDLVVNELAGRRPLVGIAAEDSGSFATLSETLHQAGFAVGKWSADAPHELLGIDVLIWDEPGHGRADLDRLADCRRALPNVPMVAILGMLRWDDWVTAKELGVSRLLAKPFLLDDFLWQVLRQLSPTTLPKLPASAF